MPSGGYRQQRPRKWRLLGMIVVGHLLALAGFARLLAPDFTAAMIEQAGSLVTVTVATWEEPEPDATPTTAPWPDPAEGEAAEEARDAAAREVTAPPVPQPRPDPAPRAASTGAADVSGAAEQGAGTGAGGAGAGAGSGRAGRGRGGVAVTGPSVRSGTISSARDFPIPSGGRQTRAGTSVTVEFTVGVDGRASDCSVRDPGPDPATNALVCPLVIERIRFNPARNAAGDPVPARYGWRQDFFRR